VIRFPKRHIADSTVARIMVASQRVARTRGAQTGPSDLDLVELPPMSDGDGMEPTGDIAAPPQTAVAQSTGAELGSSGLDMGTMMQGGDSFDAMTKGMHNGAR